jgi:hypothetical protein
MKYTISIFSLLLSCNLLITSSFQQPQMMLVQQRPTAVLEIVQIPQPAQATWLSFGNTLQALTTIASTVAVGTIALDIYKERRETPERTIQNLGILAASRLIDTMLGTDTQLLAAGAVIVKQAIALSR